MWVIWVRIAIHGALLLWGVAGLIFVEKPLWVTYLGLAALGGWFLKEAQDDLLEAIRNREFHERIKNIPRSKINHLER